MNKIKIQHYVPRFYLSNFSMINGKNYLINCFSKSLPKKMIVNIRNICGEKYFYDISKDTNQLIEKRLGNFESKFNLVYNKVINIETLEYLTEDERITFAFFIATQWIRTKEQRETIKDMIKQLTKRLSREKLSEELEKQLKRANTEEYSKELHLSLLEDLPEYVRIILSMKWILFKNKTSIPYWTSDHPINLYNPIDLWPYGNIGLSCKGIQIFFPLNSNISICLCDPKIYFLLPSKYEITDVQNIIFQNHLQVKWSTSHIFSVNNDFSLAEKMIKENPELKDITRKRMSVN